MTHFVRSFRSYFREYCTNTSIHGFRYIGEKRTTFEKIWWIFVLFLCFSVCTFSIYTVYKKWEQSPVIITVGNKGTPIYEIPFPAVTICPISKSQGGKYNYTLSGARIDEDENITDTEWIRFQYMSMLCWGKELAKPTQQIYSEEFYDFLDEVKPFFSPFRCINENQEIMNCEELFIPIITEEGICYSYNLLDRSEMFRENVVFYKNYQQLHNKSLGWSNDFGYEADADLLTYPRRALLAGLKDGFKFFILTFNNDLDYLCSGDSGQGYKVSIHSPVSYPRPSKKHFMLPLDKSIVAGVLPSMTTTSKSLKSYSKDRRRCYFQSERHLEFFNIYSLPNCQLECLANFTLDFCGCVNFFMPRDNRTKVCGNTKISCMEQAERKLQLKDLENKIKKKQFMKTGKSLSHCDCLPLCIDLNYDTEVSQNSWHWDKRIKTLNKAFSTKNYHLSTLKIYFKTDTFTTFERHEFYEPIDFLANFGGILGLFTGVSVLSLIEILYFSTVRVLCNRWMYGQWAGQGTQKMFHG